MEFNEKEIKALRETKKQILKFLKITYEGKGESVTDYELDAYTQLHTELDNLNLDFSNLDTLSEEILMGWIDVFTEIIPERIERFNPLWWHFRVQKKLIQLYRFKTLSS
jgi:hypothetical protein